MKHPERARYVAGMVLLLAILGSISIIYQSQRLDLVDMAKMDVCKTITSDKYTQEDGVVELPISCAVSVGEDHHNWKFTINEGVDKEKVVTFYDDSGVERQVVEVPTLDAFWVEYINLSHDVNGDGYRDLLLARTVNRGDVFYDYLLFNKDRHIFEANDTLVSIPNAFYNPKNHSVEGTLVEEGNIMSEIRFDYIDGYFAKSTAKKIIQ